MKIQLRDIPPSGLRIDAVYAHDLVDQREEDGLVFIEPFQLKLKLDKAEESLLASGDVIGKLRATCGRCLVEVEQEYKTKISFECPLTIKTQDSIDISEDIRQEILLNLPLTILCSQHCKGICPGCGVNLNENNCKCQS